MTKKGGVTFQDLSLAQPVLKTLAEVGPLFEVLKGKSSTNEFKNGPTLT